MKFKFDGWAQDYGESLRVYQQKAPEAVREIIARADEICCRTFVFQDHWEMERTHLPVHFEGPVDWNCVPDGDPEWLYALNRHTIFLNLAKAYRFTKDAKYARAFAELAADWLIRVPLTQAGETTTWRSLEAGLRVENWLKSLQLFSGCRSIDQSLVQRMLHSLAQHRAYLQQASGAFQRLSNWGVLQDYGLLQLGFLLEDRGCVQTAVERLESQAALQIFDDGSHWEQSPMYHCEVLHCFVNALLLAKKHKTAFSRAYKQRVHAMARALGAWCKPDGCLPCQSDSDAIDARDLLAVCAVAFGDPELKFYAGEALPPEAVWTLDKTQQEQYAALPARPPQNLSCALPDSGNYFLRSGPEENCAWLHMHCGCLGSGHGHADLLHLDLTAYGQDILVDSGRYTYVNSPLRRQLKLPAAHNTTRVDDIDFSECVDSWGYASLAPPVKGEYRFTPLADYLSGGHLGYIRLLGGGVFTQRKVVYLKPDLYLIADEFFAAGTHQYEQYFHFAPEGQVRLTGAGVHFSGPRAHAQLFCLGDGLHTELTTQPCSREYNRLENGICLSVKRRATEFAWFLTVIAVQPAGCAADVSAELLEVSLLKSGETLPPEKAQAVRIVKDGVERVVLLCHAEIISEVDLLAAGGYSGYGKTVVFGPECPAGQVLAW